MPKCLLLACREVVVVEALCRVRLGTGTWIFDDIPPSLAVNIPSSTTTTQTVDAERRIRILVEILLKETCLLTFTDLCRKQLFSRERDHVDVGKPT